MGGRLGPNMMPWLVTAPPPPHENLTSPAPPQDVRAGLGVESHHAPPVWGVEFLDDLRLDSKLLVTLAGGHRIEEALGYVIDQNRATQEGIPSGTRRGRPSRRGTGETCHHLPGPWKLVEPRSQSGFFLLPRKSLLPRGPAV